MVRRRVVMREATNNNNRKKVMSKLDDGQLLPKRRLWKGSEDKKPRIARRS
jgi:hypothetical protein